MTIGGDWMVYFDEYYKDEPLEDCKLRMGHEYIVEEDVLGDVANNVDSRPFFSCGNLDWGVQYDDYLDIDWILIKRSTTPELEPYLEGPWTNKLEYAPIGSGGGGPGSGISNTIDLYNGDIFDGNVPSTIYSHTTGWTPGTALVSSANPIIRVHQNRRDPGVPSPTIRNIYISGKGLPGQVGIEILNASYTNIDHVAIVDCGIGIKVHSVYNAGYPYYPPSSLANIAINNFINQSTSIGRWCEKTNITKVWCVNASTGVLFTYDQSSAGSGCNSFAYTYIYDLATTLKSSGSSVGIDIGNATLHTWTSPSGINAETATLYSSYIWASQINLATTSDIGLRLNNQGNIEGAWVDLTVNGIYPQGGHAIHLNDQTSTIQPRWAHVGHNHHFNVNYTQIQNTPSEFADNSSNHGDTYYCPPPPPTIIIPLPSLSGTWP
jgi:hypothetical protein